MIPIRPSGAKSSHSGACMLSWRALRFAGSTLGQFHRIIPPLCSCSRIVGCVLQFVVAG